jgi:glycosyltransferase involved in cell wall biosynthesis
MPPKKAISCVIAAYNEAARIGEVLRAVSGHPLLAEVIVIDDASRDGTADVVKQFPGVKLLRHETNKGKTVAVADGIAAATGEWICALDADLIGITAESVTRLVTPVMEGAADVSISIRENCMWYWRPIGLDYISGERVFPKSLLADRRDAMMRIKKFGLEVFMNRLIVKERLRLAIVFLPGVISPLKYAKEGFWRGLRGDMGMIWDIMRTVPPWKIVGQIVAMKRLQVRTPELAPHWASSSAK